MDTPAQIVAPLTPFLAAEIRAEMGRRNMSAAALALRLGKPKTTAYRWSSGQTPIPVDDLPDVAAAIGVDLVELLTSAVTRRGREVVELEAAVAAGGHVNTRCSPRLAGLLTPRQELAYAV